MKIENDWQRFSDLIMAMADGYNNSLSAFQVQLWWEDLSEYSWEQVSSAARQIRRTHVYNSMPKVAQFILIIDPPEDSEAIAIEALSRFRNLMIRFGCDQSVVIVDDPAFVCTINALLSQFHRYLYISSFYLIHLFHISIYSLIQN